jgi:hypothetical protein
MLSSVTFDAVFERSWVYERIVVMSMESGSYSNKWLEVRGNWLLGSRSKIFAFKSEDLVSTKEGGMLMGSG